MSCGPLPLCLCRYVFNCVQQAAGGGGGVVSSGNPEDADNDESEMVFLEFQVRNLTKSGREGCAVNVQVAYIGSLVACRFTMLAVRTHAWLCRDCSTAIIGH